MKIYTSYFYQLRFFPPNAIPISTCISDPKWYHNNRGNDYVFKDKRSVYNGIRNELLHPGKMCEGLCGGPSGCTSNPDSCLFLHTYGLQLCAIDIHEFLNGLNALVKRVQAREKWEEEPIIILLVHEAPDNPCSERKVLQDWLRGNGIHVEEWHRSNGRNE